MNVSKIVIPIITLILSIVSFTISYLQSKEKGFLFNNSYIYASKEERNSMDKKPEYKQSKIVFAFIGLIFLIVTVEIITEWNWLFFVRIALVICVIIYAICSSIKGLKSNSK